MAIKLRIWLSPIILSIANKDETDIPLLENDEVQQALIRQLTNLPTEKLLKLFIMEDWDTEDLYAPIGEVNADESSMNDSSKSAPDMCATCGVMPSEDIETDLCSSCFFDIGERIARERNAQRLSSGGIKEPEKQVSVPDKTVTSPIVGSVNILRRIDRVATKP